MTAVVDAAPAWTPGRNQDCLHVVCVGGACLYRPEVPTIGPELPVTIRDSQGGLWVRHDGLVLYRQKPGGGYDLITWPSLFSDYMRKRDAELGRFPLGPWTVDFAGHWPG